MQIKIYQISPHRDKKNVMFLGFEELQELKGIETIDFDIYDTAFCGDVDCVSLEDIFTTFNLDHPDVYKGRSLSVSDIIEVVENTDNISKGFYFCDLCGFAKITPTKNEYEKTVWIKQSN